MDGVSSQELYARLGAAAAPVLVDVRRAGSFGTDQAVIIGAIYRPPESVSDWRADLPKNREVVVYCVRGREVSQGVAKALQNAGIKVAYLEGGIAGWKEQGLPTRRKRDASEKVGDPRAPEDRSHRLSVAHQPLRQSGRGVHLRAAERRRQGRRRCRRHAL